MHISQSKNRLVTFGCSLTYGQHLPAQFPRDGTDVAHSLAWPNLVAHSMGLQVHNLSQPGSSNKKIWYDAHGFEPLPQDIVIVQWSFLKRWCLIHGPNHTQDIGPWVENEQALHYYKHLYSLYDLVVDFYLRVRDVQQRFAHSTVLHIAPPYYLGAGAVDELVQIPGGIGRHPEFIDVPNIWQKHLPDRARDKWHPGPNTHKLYAERIEQVIQTLVK